MQLFSTLAALMSVASVVSAASTPSPSPTVSPIPLPRGSFDLEGFAKDNPIGPVTGGTGGPSQTFNAADVDVEKALKKAVKGDDPLTIVLEGRFNLTARIKVNGANKTIIGKNATLLSGLSITNATNVIVKNITFRAVVGNDAITIQNSTRVWIDHNDLSSDRHFLKDGPDLFDGLLDIVRASDWITVSWNHFHDHWKASLVGNNANFSALDRGHLHVTYHHNFWNNLGTRGHAGRFGHQHSYNNFYHNYHFQAIHSRSDNQVLVEGNVFAGNTSEALSTFGLVIPMDSPNTSPLGDPELDGFANLGAPNDFGGAGVNITQKGNFTTAPYAYKLSPLADVRPLVVRYSGVGKL